MAAVQPEKHFEKWWEEPKNEHKYAIRSGGDHFRDIIFKK